MLWRLQRVGCASILHKRSAYDDFAAGGAESGGEGDLSTGPGGQEEVQGFVGVGYTSVGRDCAIGDEGNGGAAVSGGWLQLAGGSFSACNLFAGNRSCVAGEQNCEKR